MAARALRFANLLFVGFAIGASTRLAADEIVLEEGLNGYGGTSDTSIYKDRSSNSNGGHENIFSGASLSSARRALIRFDLGQVIPSGSTILSVALRLNMEGSGPNSATETYSLNRLALGWGEGTVDSGDPGGLGAAAQQGDATWDQNRFLLSDWLSPGGDFLAIASAQTAVPKFDPLVAENNLVTIASPGLAQDVRSWLDDPETNHGWILIGAESSSRSARRFTSSEGVQGLRPRLAIGYTPPQTRAAIWNLYR
jgi:hypothetical protein